MKIKAASEYKQIKPSVVTIGTFDGVHIGHQKIIKRIVEIAKKKNLQALVLTFFPHPRMVVQNDSSIKLINTIDEKAKQLESMGVNHLVIKKFTKSFSRLSALEYVRDVLVNKLKVKHIIVGYDHHFGKDREGGPEFLTKYCLDNSINLEIIEPVSDDDNHISSTRIRNLIKNGYVRRANFELGSVYGFNAIVVKGAGGGKEVSFPTANVIPLCENQLMPKSGV